MVRTLHSKLRVQLNYVSYTRVPNKRKHTHACVRHSKKHVLKYMWTHARVRTHQSKPRAQLHDTHVHNKRKHTHTCLKNSMKKARTQESKPHALLHDTRVGNQQRHMHACLKHGMNKNVHATEQATRAAT
jgi:hypothetical protein